MPEHDSNAIVRIVDKMEGARSKLHALMDGDVDLYNQETYKGEIGEDGKDTLAGYKHFTSNDPTTTMDLALHLGSTAKVVIRVQQARAQEEQQEIDNMKELFCLGMRESIDERRASLDMPDLLDSLFAQSLFRGRIAQRVLLVKEVMQAATENEPEITRTYVDVTDWDPRNTYHGIGKHGLAWACEKSMKSRRNLMDEYDIDPAEGEQRTTLSESDYDEDYAVYDWMEETTNTVVVERRTSLDSSSNGVENTISGSELKKPIRHGMVRTAAVVIRSSLKPTFTSINGAKEDTNDNGAFFKASRKLFGEQNFTMSIVSEIVKRSITPALNVYSKDGSFSVDADPRVTGMENSLATDNDEDIKPMELVQLAQEAGTLLGVITAMIQRGTFPASAFGELAFQLSGFAITQLRQGLQAPLTPHIKAVQRAMKQILDLIADSYATGFFDTMTLSGSRQNAARTYFSQEITPELVSAGGTIEVEIIAQLPKDDAAKVSLVQMLREGPGGVPLVDDKTAREMLDFQDVEQIDRNVWEQLAERGSPMAIAFNSMMAAAKQGNEELAQIWQQELQLEMQKKFLEVMQLAMLGVPAPGGTNGNGASPTSKTTPSSSSQPPEERGVQGAPINQAGPLVGAGTPRPGAQSTEARLANIGLVGSRG